jgi:hypothetical protein
MHHMTIVFAITTVEALRADAHKLATATITDVHNYRNTSNNPAKRIQATLGALNIEFIKNPTENTISAGIFGRTAIHSGRGVQLFRDRVTMTTKLSDIAISLLQSGDRGTIYKGHAIATALLGYDPCGF